MRLCNAPFFLWGELMKKIDQRFVVHRLVFENRVDRLPANEPRYAGIDELCIRYGSIDSLVAPLTKSLYLVFRWPICARVLGRLLNSTRVYYGVKKLFEAGIERRHA